MTSNRNSRRSDDIRSCCSDQDFANCERTRPELLAVNVRYLYQGMQNHPVTQWLTPRYYHWAGHDDGQFQLFIRLHGSLEARLRDAR